MLVDGQIVGPQNPTHAMVAKPVLGGIEESLKRFGIIFRFDHPEKAFLFLVKIQVKLVNLGADATDRVTVAIGIPGLKLRMFEIGVVG
jgi:hypothetical protein